MLLFIGASEIIIILLFVVVFFGANKIPSFARSAGKFIREIKHASNEIKEEINKNANIIKEDRDINT